jgi:hypothetical protein
MTTSFLIASFALLAWLAPLGAAHAATAPASDASGGAGDPERAALASVIAGKFRDGSRYMMPNDGCKPAAEDAGVANSAIVRPYLDAVTANPGSGARVVACTYSYEEIKRGPQQQGFGVFLDLPPALIAGWITSACRAASSANIRACGLALIEQMHGDNGGQYPIAAFVAEGSPADGLCQQRSHPVPKEGLIGFRYGVTVQFAEVAGGGEPIIFYCTTDPVSIDTQRSVSLTQTPTNVYNSGRVAGLNYKCWSSAFPRPKAQGLAPDPWQQIVHESMVAALKGGTNTLFDRAAWLYVNRARHPTGCSIF